MLSTRKTSRKGNNAREHYTLFEIIHQLYHQNCWLINFICKYIPLKQWAYEDSHSPKYQKFKIDKLPLILDVEPWDYRDFMAYLQWRYPDDKPIKPIRRRSECDIPDDCKCPRCNTPKICLYKNNGSKGQLQCKVCQTLFSSEENRHTSLEFRCPYCTHTLVPMKDRKLEPFFFDSFFHSGLYTIII